MQMNYIILHYITLYHVCFLYYIILRYITLYHVCFLYYVHYITLYYVILHYTMSVSYITLYYIIACLFLICVHLCEKYTFPILKGTILYPCWLDIERGCRHFLTWKCLFILLINSLIRNSDTLRVLNHFKMFLMINVLNKAPISEYFLISI